MSLKCNSPMENKIVQIPLNGIRGAGKFFLVDERDAAKVLEHKWYLEPRGYVKGFVNGESILLHRFIYGAQTGDTEVIDHIDRNRLNNSRSNLIRLSIR